jgi:hypothetical protein
MSSALAIILCAATIPATILGAAISPSGPSRTASTQPVFAEIPKSPNGLTLYNAKGEIVAKCEKKDDAFGDCKMEPGVTLDDLMNAWVHAYQDMQK